MALDPISATASVITLLGAAGQTCKVLYNFFLDIADAPSEIRDHSIRLECLHRTLSTLVQVYSELPENVPTDAPLCSRITEFMKEAEKARDKFSGRDCSPLSIRERLRWFSSDRQLRKFFTSLTQWDIIFTQAILAAQTSLLMKIKEQTTPTTGSPLPGYVMTKELSSLQSLDQQPIVRRSRQQRVPTKRVPKCVEKAESQVGFEQVVSKRLMRYLTEVSDPVGLRLRNWHILAMNAISLDIKSGPTVVRKWIKGGHEQYIVLPVSNSYSISLILESNKHVPYRWSIVIHSFYEWSFVPSLSFQCQLKVSKQIQRDSASCRAAQTGQLGLLRQLFSEGKARTTDILPCGNTLLHIASRYGHTDVVLFLLSAGADIDAANDFGQTPLHLAIGSACSYNVARHLLAQGADPFFHNQDGQTPFHMFYNDAIKHLTRNNREYIDTTIQDSNGKTIVHYICNSSRSVCEDIAWIPECQFQQADSRGLTALHYAVKRGNIPLVQFFLNRLDSTHSEHVTKTTTMTQLDHYGRTLLHYATESSRTEIIDILLSRGCNIDAVDHKKRTLTHHAASIGKVKAIRKLVELGATDQLSAVDLEGNTPMDLARSCSAHDVVEFLRSTCTNTERENDDTAQIKHQDRISSTVKQWSNIKAFSELGLFLAGILFTSLILISLLIFHPTLASCYDFRSPLSL